MAKVLISVSELADALGRVPKIDVGGEPHIEAGSLLAVTQALTGGLPAGGLLNGATGPTVAQLAHLPQPEPEAVEGDPRFADSPADAAERARLMALPPGPCICAGRFAASPDHPGHNPATHIHPGVNCPMCSSLSQGCEAHEYVDTTIRDPRQARLESGVQQDPVVQPLPHVEPDFSRPAANDNAFRPPSGSPDVRGADYSDL